MYDPNAGTKPLRTNRWQCANCGFIVESDDRPVKHWDDGHYCSFIEIVNMPKLFVKLNDLLVKRGYDTEHPTNEPYENIIVRKDGEIVAAISEMPRSNLVKVLKAIGEVESFAPTDTKRIIDMVRR